MNIEELASITQEGFHIARKENKELAETTQVEFQKVHEEIDKLARLTLSEFQGVRQEIAREFGGVKKDIRNLEMKFEITEDIQKEVSNLDIRITNVEEKISHQ